MKIILFGASGMVGQGVLRECLNDAEVSEVLCVGRSALALTHPKLKTLIVKDMRDYASVQMQLVGYDACYFCLGASAAGKSEADYAAVNYDIPMAIGKTLAQLKPQMSFIYVSGKGTDSSAQGGVMWARVKGRTENDLLALPLKAYMFRPGMIEPMHGEVSRTLLYSVPIALMKPVFPWMRKRFPHYVTSTEAIGRAMLNVTRRGYALKRLESIDINKASESA